MAVKCIKFFIETSQEIPEEVTIEMRGVTETLKVDKFLTKHFRTKDLVSSLSKLGYKVSKETDESTLLKLARYRGINDISINKEEIFVIKNKVLRN
ncbi:hypothetical protein QX249_13165 [Vibrio parahaemolyticus]|uniref:Uncharacterized protein n=1 Tax=Vibrio parahaemolyticus TaxID=670 RepID=A0AAW8Q051_VIBPH|nr:hypothetical protein [Vibrio parahaemolyticus]MDS1821617.1 hypothetical protein [Vibrio parahaemolyticus]